MKKLLQGDKLIIQVQFDLVSSQVQGYITHPVDYFDPVDQYSEVIMDISAVNNIDSNGITFVIGIYKAAINKGKKFKMVGMHQDIFHVFQLIKLNEVFEIELA
jgi:anti-anti-sigma factor